MLRSVKKTLASFRVTDNNSSRRRPWDPAALRPWNLLLGVLLCWTSIAVLQFYMSKSQRDGGVIFAPKVNDLPLSQTFVYLYMPTILAVVFSIFWVWVDIDAKRYQPFHEMSKPEGALGKDSLLLHYPFDFIPIVPFFALRKRHWLVFWASAATVLTTFGIVPLQSGIFITKDLIQNFPQSFAISTKHMEASMQENTLTLRYAQSAYAILTLNETLPKYMMKDYTLAPFEPINTEAQDQESWTSETMLYSLDLHCESATESILPTRDTPSWNSTTGCGFPDSGDLGNSTIEAVTDESVSRPRVKDFSATFIGYYHFNEEWEDQERTRALSLELFCSENDRAKHQFMAAFAQNKEKESDSRKKPTVIFCTPSYYQQRVRATVDATSRAPQQVTPLGEKEPLSSGLFDQKLFEFAMYAGARDVVGRTNNVPFNQLPKYYDRIANKSITNPVTPNGESALAPMAAMALMSEDRDLKDYLDPVALAQSYEKAVRLSFARAMNEILEPDYAAGTRTAQGERTVKLEAVTLEPVFTYIVEGLLGAVSVAGLGLLLLSVIRKKRLYSDPGTIASMMSLVADDTILLTRFDTLDTCSNKYLQKTLNEKRFKLTDGDAQPGIQEVQIAVQNDAGSPNGKSPSTPDAADLKLAKPTRPVQFRFFVAALVATLFAGLAITLAVLFHKSRPHGLRLPTQNKIVQSLLTNYLPTAIATLIEPLWILINRLFCMLQPLEELQGSGASAAKSIDLNYSSLPPQLTIFKALRSGHFTLATVCVMALLANVLAATFAGLFFKDTHFLASQMAYVAPFDAQFVSLNGSVGPQTPANFSGAYQGGTGEDHFLVAESNYTQNTSLPGWVDDNAMYLPFSIPATPNGATERRFRARTKYFRAEANCKPLVLGEDYTIPPWDPETPSGQVEDTFTPVIETKDRQNIVCSWQDEYGDPNLGIEWAVGWRGKCISGKVAMEKMSQLTAGPNATDAQNAACRSAVALGWLRYETTGDRGCRRGNNKTITEDNVFFMTCQPRLVVGEATILVDSNGRLVENAVDVKPDEDQSSAALQQYFTNDAGNVMTQSNNFIFKSLSPGWHNHSFAGEPIHYFMNRAANNLRLTDPNEKIPRFADVEGPMNSAYSKLFAIWLGVHTDKLFVPSSNAQAKLVPGEIIQKEERVFFKTPLFIISEIILGIYIIVTGLIYLRRPGRYLARMPTCVAAVIALFAATAAVKDMQGTSNLTTKERAEHLKQLGNRYGYGSYVGSDGMVHIGVEKMPFVRYRKNTTFEYSRFDMERRRATTGLTEETFSPTEKKPGKTWLGRITTSALPSRG